MLAHELEVGAEINSEYVVQTIDGDADGDSPWITQQWLEGETIENLLGRQHRLSSMSVVWLARQIVEGLADLANAGYSHGDLKPANLLITHEHQLKLIDLGFACPFGSSRGLAGHDALTGTIEYMAPEVLSREATTSLACDLYSVGVTLFRMLTGHLPFVGESLPAILKLQRSVRPKRVIEQNPFVPLMLSDLIAEMMAKQPIKRPSDLAKLLRFLLDLELDLLSIRTLRSDETDNPFLPLNEVSLDVKRVS
jgi:serine/threonine protein kinase